MMPGTTPKGYPYAQPADPLVQWPATSQALAEKIDADTAAFLAALPAGVKVRSGVLSNQGSAAIDVGPDFTQVPAVVVTCSDTGQEWRGATVVMAGPRYGTIRIYDKAGTQTTAGVVYWIAVGV